MAWGHVDDEMAEAVFADGLQMETDGFHMHAVDEGCGGFQDGPRQSDEFMQTAAGYLRLDALQFDFGRVEREFRVVATRLGQIGGSR